MNLQNLTLLLISFLLHYSAKGKVVDPIILEQELLWEGGEHGIDTFRIPLLETINGSILAFSEARISSHEDITPKRVAFRVSRDGGFEWSQTQFIIDSGNNSNLFLGSTVVDEMTQTIFLFFTINENGTNQNKYIRSTNEGMSWSEPIDISHQIGFEMFSPGVGHGLQVKHNSAKRGRLLVCGHTHGSDGTKDEGMICIYSDDHGATWKRGLSYWGIPYNSVKIEGDLQPGEVVMTEFPDGSIYFNVRNSQHYHCKCRIEMLSHDGGESFDPQSQKVNGELVDSGIAAAVEYTNNLLFFANAFNENVRINMSLHWSADKGGTWPGSFVMYAGPSGYVATTTLALHQERLYLLYEWGLKNYYQYISFVILSVDGILQF